LTATDLVGREAEQRVLIDVIDAGLTGIAQWVVFEGEPGIGKTRLLEHLAHGAHATGYQVHWGRCFESGAPPAFWLWLGVLRGLVDPDDPLPTPTQDVIDRLLSPHAEEEHTAPVDANRYRLFEAISLLLHHAARRRPVMLALDDVQWADPASLELIEFISGSVVGARVVIACTVRQLELARNDAVVQALATISRRPLAKRLQLQGLDAQESAALARLTVDSDLSPDVIKAIHLRSEGNPFFLGELARLLVADEGLSAAEQVRRAAVPAGVRDVVHRRLVRLPPTTIELIQAAATIGRETTLGLLSRAAAVTLDQCIDDLEPAFVNRLIVETVDGSGSIRFSHALVREVVLDDMSMLRRSRLHLQVADAIEAGATREDDAEIVAEHLWQAAALGVQERAASALERAAEIALQRFAYESADALFERAIQLRSEFPSDRADPAAELDLLNRLIQVRRVRGGFEQARLNSPIPRAKELARETNRESVLIAVLWTEWAGACTSCDFPLARELALELRQLGAESADPIMRGTGEACWGILCWHLGNISEAVECLDRACAELDSAAGSAALIESQILTRCFHVAVRAMAGDVVGDESPLPHMAEVAPDPYAQLVIWVFESIRSLWSGQFDHARRAVSKALAIDVGDSFALFGAGALSLDGCLKAISGKAIEGAGDIERGAELYMRNGTYTFMPFYYAIGVKGLADEGHLDDARRMLDLASTILQRTGERWQEPFVRCAEARLLHASSSSNGQASESVTLMLREAHELAVEQGAHGTAAHVARVAAEVAVALPA
jgi:tetratricopeptide (TPR) repeat protein